MMSADTDQKTGRLEQHLESHRDRIVSKLEEQMRSYGLAAVNENAVEWDVIASHLYEHFKLTAQTEDPQNTAHYLAWFQDMIAYHDPSRTYDPETNRPAYIQLLQLLEEQLYAFLDQKYRTEISKLVKVCRQKTDEITGTRTAEVSRFTASGELARLTKSYYQALIQGKRHKAMKWVLDAVKQGTSVADIYLKVFQPALYETGLRWQHNEISVAQEHFFTASTQLIMSQLYPWIFGTERNGYTMVTASVGGELHEVGIRMISDLFEQQGYDSILLGANCPAADIVDHVMQNNAQLLALSVATGPSLKKAHEVIEAVRGNVQCKDTLILAGGYLFNDFADPYQLLDADFITNDVREALSWAKRAFNQDNEPGVQTDDRFLDQLIEGHELLRSSAHQQEKEQRNSYRKEVEAEAEETGSLDPVARINNDLAVMQRSLARKRVELERVIAEKNEMMGMMVHDLRNPLTSIMGFAELLLDENQLTGHQRDFLQNMYDSCSYMLQLVEDILDFSRLERGGSIKLNTKDVELVDLVDRIVSLNSHMARKKEITVNHDKKVNRIAIQADADKLEQVMHNLLSNAIKFSDAGDRISVSTERDPDKGEVAIAVTDQGVGISEQEQKQLFQPFSQTSSKATKGEKGTGLGLAISKSIIEAHGGNIQIQSSPGKGSTFTVTLPERASK